MQWKMTKANRYIEDLVHPQLSPHLWRILVSLKEVNDRKITKCNNRILGKRNLIYINSLDFLYFLYLEEKNVYLYSIIDDTIKDGTMINNKIYMSKNSYSVQRYNYTILTNCIGSKIIENDEDIENLTIEDFLIDKALDKL